MQVSKVAVVATGALATAAAMGSTPAFAADSEGVPAVAPATVGVLDYEGKHRASDEAMRELAAQWLTVAPEQTWPAPWEQEPAQVLSLGSGSALSLAPWQQCGSHGPFVAGGSAPISSPATVLGDCSNGNVDVSGDGGSDAVFSILDGTAVSALSFQQCAAGVGGAGASMPIASPATVGGSCDNGNISASTSEGMPAPIESPAYGNGIEVDGAEAAPAAAEVTEAATAREEQAIVPEAEQVGSAGSGSATGWLSWQQCASPGPFAAGGSAPISSPTTVLGDCSNGNIDITGDASDAVFSLLDRSAMSVASFQQCGSAVGGGGISTPVASPATVGGSCDNGNISVG